MHVSQSTLTKQVIDAARVVVAGAAAAVEAAIAAAAAVIAAVVIIVIKTEHSYSRGSKCTDLEKKIEQLLKTFTVLAKKFRYWGALCQQSQPKGCLEDIMYGLEVQD